MAQAFGPIDMAKIAVTGSDSSYIVLEVENAGSSSRWSQQFPSLDRDQLETLSEQSATFLEYATRAEAVEAFHTITADCADGSIGCVLAGRITFVSLPYDQDDGHDVVTWHLEDDTRPVWQGREWKDEQIVERI